MRYNFNFGLNIAKKDVLTIVLLSLVFFSMAVTNLGATQVPSNSLTVNSDTTQVAIIDLGHPDYVSSICFYIRDCKTSSTIKIYTSQYDDVWFECAAIVASYPFAYMNWNNTYVYQVVQYIRLEFEAPSNIEINEVAILNGDNQVIPVFSVNSENSTTSSLDFNLLFDEQSLVVLPNTYMTETMFDEVYFTRTSEQYLNLQWPYEWTHPPFGKLVISTGIAAFGLNPFGWRIMGVIFGTLMIPLIFLLGKKMFGSYIGGFSAAFLLTFDFMHFSEARLGITDTYVVFFSLLSHLCFFIYFSNVIKKGWQNASVVPLLFSFVFFALGFSTKWLVLFGFLGELAILVMLRLSEVMRCNNSFSDKLYDLFDYRYLYLLVFIFVAIGVYFITYIPDVLAGRPISSLVELQNSMYAYHADPIGLDHPYSSPTWSWPIIMRPLWLYFSTLSGGMRSTISLFGNPAVWWVGFVAILALTGFCLFRVVVYIRKRFMQKIELSVVFLSVVFFAQWLPYFFVSRGLFIYHYYVNVPILCLGSTYFISKYWKYTWMKLAALIYFIAVVALFVLFYPVISGMPVLTVTAESLRWFTQWVF
ncbi:MAG: phospholipid carrier-dependent glycosyltransferase [Candidatus Bathyarchaeota archaeon]|nr:phospholipid carrier-dependent glycosyltransferase [Candidatus Termiticorpusculum sp.]